ncbi:MAG: cytochrome C oxidase subunit IV family protein [Acidobacteria bacterium]|nr:cytochrome C oxidase subunit IV family protein [Acidobacteriota bacterium]
MGANQAHEHAEGGSRLYLIVWGGLLGLTLVEVFLAYVHLPVNTMLVLLMGLSVIKAALIIAYFMHLRFERFNLFLVLVPMWILVTCLLFMFFPDSFRLQEFRFPR